MSSLYSDRLKVLKKAYRTATKNNAVYTDASKSVAEIRAQIGYIRGIGHGLRLLESIIAEREKEWREAVLRDIEAEIMQDLSFVYPDDGYSVKLSSRILRGKVHVDAYASSYFSGDISGDVCDSQGRLFQQIVSFAALIGVMRILNVNTIYIDEAFSGASKKNVSKINRLLKSVQERGINIILIAQDTSMAYGIDANSLILTRSLDNKTSITQIGGIYD